MKYGAFVDLVNAMREAQRAYFKNRSTNALVTSKECEANVDKALKAIAVLRERARQSQPVPASLFETPASEVEGWIGHA